MYAWEYGFDDAQITQWIDQCLTRYVNDGYAYYAGMDKESGALLGLIGLLNEYIDGDVELGVGYILARCHWGKGYAYEGAKGCLFAATTHYPEIKTYAANTSGLINARMKKPFPTEKSMSQIPSSNYKCILPLGCWCFQ